MRSNAAKSHSLIKVEFGLMDMAFNLSNDRRALNLDLWVENITGEEYALFAYTSPTIGLEGLFLQRPELMVQRKNIFTR